MADDEQHGIALLPSADTVSRFISLGASRINIWQGDPCWVVMADPDGNEFCVLTAR